MDMMDLRFQCLVHAGGDIKKAEAYYNFVTNNPTKKETPKKKK